MPSSVRSHGGAGWRQPRDDRAKPPPPGERVTLDSSEAPRLLAGLCVENATTYWKPSEDIVATIDAKLDDGLRQRGDQLTDYHRRYVGVEADGKRLVCVSATTVEATDRVVRIDEHQSSVRVS